MFNIKIYPTSKYFTQLHLQCLWNFPSLQILTTIDIFLTGFKNVFLLHKHFDSIVFDDFYVIQKILYFKIIFKQNLTHVSKTHTYYVYKYAKLSLKQFNKYYGETNTTATQIQFRESPNFCLFNLFPKASALFSDISRLFASLVHIL